MRIGQGIYRGHSQLVVQCANNWVIPANMPSWPKSINDVLTLLDGDEQYLEVLRNVLHALPESACVSSSEITFTAPIPRPRKNIICLGWNYLEHAQESAAVQGKEVKRPEYPIFFTKATTSVSGPEDDVIVDSTLTTQLDWEVELGVVIGKLTKNVSVERALDSVFGYTVINDLSARDLQFRHKQYFLGKSLDGACPMGPWITTADEIPDPHCLALSCRVNGVIKQESNTANQIFSVAQVISTLSSVMTLEPGDVIATGTPSGVGFARMPPEYLKHNDTVECWIAGVGTLKNRIIYR